MPTGYTHILKDKPDLPFADFALRCARAMGALVMLRDGSIDDPIPADVGEPLDHYRQRIDSTRREKEHVLSLSPEAWRQEHEKARIDAANRREEWRADAARWRDVCQRLLCEVDAWKPPTADHEQLAEFMRGQLTETLRFDGTEPSVEWDRVPEFAEWQKARIEEACRRAADAEADLAKAIERNRARNEWVRALRESLNGASK